MRVGVAFPRKDGTGFNVELNALPPDGRIVLFPPQADERAEEDPAAEAPPLIQRQRPLPRGAATPLVRWLCYRFVLALVTGSGTKRTLAEGRNRPGTDMPPGLLPHRPRRFDGRRAERSSSPHRP